jgi:TIR domain
MTEDLQFEFDVALSFAGEDRAYVADVARLLKAAQVRVFYDEYETATLWGKDLYAHLSEVYEHKARYTVLFASAHYVQKVWTSHERKSAQARAIREREAYILPARFDDTEIPGLTRTTGYVDLRMTTPPGLVSLILEKLGRRAGSWEGDPLPLLPSEASQREESLREKAKRLATRGADHRSIESLYSSTTGVNQAKGETSRLFEYVQAQTQHIKEIDPHLDISCTIRHDGVLLVRSPGASFTMYWSNVVVNTLSQARLFTAEYDGAHTIDGSRSPATGERETNVYPLFDDRLRVVWFFEEDRAKTLTTEQLGDRYLSRVLDRNFPAEVRDFRR